MKNIWLYVGIALLIVCLSECIWIMHDQAQLTKYKGAVDVYKSTQATNLATIATLQKVNTANAAQAQAQQAHAAALIPAVDEFSQFQQLQPAAAATQLKVIYASDPNARARAAAVLPSAVNDLLHANASD